MYNSTLTNCKRNLSEALHKEYFKFSKKKNVNFTFISLMQLRFTEKLLKIVFKS